MNQPNVGATNPQPDEAPESELDMPLGAALAIGVMLGLGQLLVSITGTVSCAHGCSGAQGAHVILTFILGALGIACMGVALRRLKSAPPFTKVLLFLMIFPALVSVAITVVSVVAMLSWVWFQLISSV